MNQAPSDRLRIFVRVDFVLAVLLTVIAPLVLLIRAVRSRQRGYVQAMLSYWRASSLLMIAVYLLIDKRRAGFACGVAARLLIPWTLRRADVNDAIFHRWRRAVNVYCLAGAVLNAPMLRCAFSDQLSSLCRAYIEPAQQYGDLLHPGVPRERLGRVGVWGLIAFVAGAIGFVLARVRSSRS